MSDVRHVVVIDCGQKLNWDELAARRIPAPFKPKIKNEMDTSNFSDEFTTMVPADSPAVVPLDGEKIFKVSLASTE